MSGLAEIEKRLASCAAYLRTGQLEQRSAVLETVDELLDQRNKLVGVPRLPAPARNAHCNGCGHAHPAQHMPELLVEGKRTFPVDYLICPCCDRVGEK